ncbi:MAG: hypothetical protein Q8K65_08155 [Alphaproteobacteria bacterium]|nr:hypothetical protein [Alphaproteobacteria bacterium]
MGKEGTHFPNSDAWAATMPDVRGAFKEAFPRRAAAATTEAQVDAEYKKFAKIDLSNAF